MEGRILLKNFNPYNTPPEFKRPRKPDEPDLTPCALCGAPKEGEDGHIRVIGDIHYDPLIGDANKRSPISYTYRLFCPDARQYVRGKPELPASEVPADSVTEHGDTQGDDGQHVVRQKRRRKQ